jgi:hypothetical protein
MNPSSKGVANASIASPTSHPSESAMQQNYYGLPLPSVQISHPVAYKADIITANSTSDNRENAGNSGNLNNANSSSNQHPSNQYGAPGGSTSQSGVNYALNHPLTYQYIHAAQNANANQSNVIRVPDQAYRLPNMNNLSFPALNQPVLLNSNVDFIRQQQQQQQQQQQHNQNQQSQNSSQQQNPQQQYVSTYSHYPPSSS